MILDPSMVDHIFVNTDKKTYTVGIISHESDGKGGITRKVTSQIIPRKEGDALAKQLEKIKKEEAKKNKTIEQKSGEAPPEQFSPKLYRMPNGRPISMEDVNKVKKKTL